MPRLEVALAVIVRQDRWFLQRREASSRTFPRHWEFPGGKLEPGEGPEAALHRELQEELRWTPDAVRPLAPLDFRYPEFAVRLHPFRCEGADGPWTSLPWGWFQPRQARRLRLPAASLALLDLLEA